MAANVGGIGGVFQELISPTKTPKPYVAPHVDPQAVQQQTNAGNLAALPTLEEIASGVDSFNLAQRNKDLTAAIPGYTSLVADESGTLGSWLKGDPGQAVQDAWERRSVGKSIAGGFGGSDAARNLVSRDFIEGTVGFQKAGMQALPSFLGEIAGLAIPHPFDVTSGFLTPAQGISAQQWNEEQRATQEWLKNRLDALPDPLMAAVGQAVGSEFNQDVGIAKNVFSGGMAGGATGGTVGGGGSGSIFGGGGGGGNFGVNDPGLGGQTSSFYGM